jgi:hypothetical protein
METAPSDVITAHKFPSLIDRYYTQFFAVDSSGPGEDVYVYLHTNGLMVIGLAPSHPIVLQKKPIKEVKFQSEHRDFSKNIVRGAKKKGGARLRPEGTLATVVCEDGTEFTVRSCVDASLLEVNAQLKTKPDLLHQMPATQGFLALCQPLINVKNPTDHLMSLESYRQLRFPEEADAKMESS